MLSKGMKPQDIVLDVRTLIIKPNVCKWISNSFQELCNVNNLISSGWQKVDENIEAKKSINV